MPSELSTKFGCSELNLRAINLTMGYLFYVVSDCARFCDIDLLYESEFA